MREKCLKMLSLTSELLFYTGDCYYRRARGDMIEVYKIVTDIYDPKTTNNLFKIRGKQNMLHWRIEGGALAPPPPP